MSYPAVDSIPSLPANLDEFDPAVTMAVRVLDSPGYHTTLPSGTRVHGTRYSLDYALALLDMADRSCVERAEAVITRVLDLQDTDPLSRTYGVWPWFLEEPLSQMNPPDLNWADFCGARLAVALCRWPQAISADLQVRMRAALTHAALAIFRRNTTVNYTNIALMGTAVTAMAGELLDRPELLAYGRRRLQSVLDHVEQTGGFAEYNSPTYSLVAAEELGRVLRFVRDPACREYATVLHRRVWMMIAEHFHPRTQQWAGPHARAYFNWLNAEQISRLAVATGVDLSVRVRREDGATLESPAPHWHSFDPVACPEELLHFFTSRDAPPREVRSVFTRRADGSETVGTTWFHPDACLGSVNRAFHWTQNRLLVGYWRSSRDPAVSLRLRFLKDGRDFCAIGIRQVQHGPRVLAAAFPLTGCGDYHPLLDRVPDDVFHARQLLWRLELRGVEVQVDRLTPEQFALAAGDWRAVLHALPGEFAGRPITWRVGGEDDVAWVEAVCLDSPTSVAVDHRTVEAALAVAVELLRSHEPPQPSPRVEQRQGQLMVDWPAADLHLDSPTTPQPFIF